MRKVLLLFLCCLFWETGSAQAFWKPVLESNVKQEKSPRGSMPSKFLLYQLNYQELKQALSAAPEWNNGGSSPVIVPFPDADGALMHYRVYKTSVLHPQLEAKYPGIASYAGKCIEKPTTILSFSTTLFGLHAMSLTVGNSTHYIDPYTKDRSCYIVYKKTNLTGGRPFKCLTGNIEHVSQKAPLEKKAENENVIRTYRLAGVTTAAFSAFHITAAGLDSAPIEEQREAVLAALTVTVSRLNSMFERDMAVTLQLVPNNDELIFIGSDNLMNGPDDGGAMLGLGQAVMNEVIGFDNYDIGHNFGTNGAGLVAGQICTENKGSGMTGIGAPVGDPYDIDYVAHEIGHQFGAPHTFNSNCGGNRDPSASYEPGSGSTIQAYAGVCSPSVQQHSDAQFHASSIVRMKEVINSFGNCAPSIPNSNTPPVANAGKDYVIPKGTAFILEGSGADADGDVLTYAWDQMDKEITDYSEDTPSPLAPAGPNFRSLPISDSPSRFMPRIEDVLDNNLFPEWEVIPLVAREMNFALTVRDNALIGGESDIDYMKVTVAEGAEFFRVLSPTVNGIQWESASNKNVTWDVAGTTANGVNTPYVDIFLSTDGGYTYPITLAKKVPNDGDEIVMVPHVPGQARIMVRGHDNIFYDLSNANFSIIPGQNDFYVTINSDQNITACQGTNVVYTLDYTKINGFAAATAFSVTGNPEGSIVMLSPFQLGTDGQVQVTVSNTGNVAPGFYTLTLNMVSGTITKTLHLYLDLVNANFPVVMPNVPANLAVNQPLNTVLGWQAADVPSYLVFVATDAGFDNLVAASIRDSNDLPLSGLIPFTTYYWKVKAINAVCEGEFGPVYSFTTGNEVMEVQKDVQLEFEVYPNPNTGSFTLQFEAAADGPVNIMAYDIRGRKIYSTTANASGVFTKQVELSAQPGVYLIEVQQNQKKSMKKIIIQ
jgi:hypothetical protein